MCTLRFLSPTLCLSLLLLQRAATCVSCLFSLLLLLSRTTVDLPLLLRCLCLCRCRSQSVCVLLFDAPVLVSVVKRSLHFAVVFFGNTRRSWDSTTSSSNSTKNTTTPTTRNNPTQSNSKNYKIFYAWSCWCRSVSLRARVCVCACFTFFFNSHRSLAVVGAKKRKGTTATAEIVLRSSKLA